MSLSLESYMDGMKAKYGDEVDSHPTYDHELWVEVSGGIKKGRVLGFGSVSDPQEFMVPSQASSSTTHEVNMEAIYDRIREDLMDGFRADREALEAQKQEMTRMYNEIKGLAQGITQPNPTN